MNEQRDRTLLVFQIAAGLIAAILCAGFGWLIYKGTLHPSAAPSSESDTTVAPAMAMPSASDTTPTTAITDSSAGTLLDTCAGFSYTEEKAAVEAARAAVQASAPGVPMAFLELEYRCGSIQGTPLTANYSFYASSTHTVYVLTDDGSPKSASTVTESKNTYPGDGCGAEVPWNIPSSQIAAQFISQGGAAAVNTLLQEGQGAALDFVLACMPPGNPEWHVALSSILPGSMDAKYQAYNALTGAITE